MPRQIMNEASPKGLVIYAGAFDQACAEALHSTSPTSTLAYSAGTAAMTKLFSDSTDSVAVDMSSFSDFGFVNVVT